MKDKDYPKVDLIALFGCETDSTPKSNIPTPLKPGDTDSVRLHLTEEETAEIESVEQLDIPHAIQATLSRRTEKFEHLCDHFIDRDARYTLDDGSLEIEDCEMDANGHGCIHCHFTESFYAGCRDQNSSGDPRWATLDLRLDRNGWVLTVSTTVPYEREPDEF